MQGFTHGNIATTPIGSQIARGPNSTVLGGPKPEMVKDEPATAAPSPWRVVFREVLDANDKVEIIRTTQQMEVDGGKLVNTTTIAIYKAARNDSQIAISETSVFVANALTLTSSVIAGSDPNAGCGAANCCMTTAAAAPDAPKAAKRKPRKTTPEQAPEAAIESATA